MKNLRRTCAVALATLMLCLAGCGNQYSDADIQALRDEAYQSGYDAGVTSAQETSYAEGKEAGYVEGYDAGYAEGLAAGSAEDPGETDPEERDVTDTEEQNAAGTGTGSASGSDTGNNTQTTIHGYSADRTVYVSNSGKKIHLIPDCSGMKNYTTMTLGEAEAHGYAYCSRCF